MSAWEFYFLTCKSDKKLSEPWNAQKAFRVLTFIHFSELASTKAKKQMRGQNRQPRDKMFEYKKEKEWEIQNENKNFMSN